MSGRPKRSRARMSAEKRQQLLNDALKLAEQERQRVQEAQHKAQLQQLADSTMEVAEDAAIVANKCVSINNSSIMASLRDACGDVQSQLLSVRDMQELQSLIMRLNRLSRQVDEVIRNESIAERKDKLTQDIESAQEQLSKVPAKRSERYNSGCRKRLEEQLKSISIDLNGDSVEKLSDRIAVTINDVNCHIETVNAAYLAHKAEAESALLSVQTRLDNLRDDNVTYKWHHPRITEKQKDIQRIRQQLADEDYDNIANQIGNINSYIDTLIKEAVELDVKAQERDYIADSIIKSLSEMGFRILTVVKENDGHPKTRLLFHAEKNTGEGINIGVPYEGNVEYDIGGYPMHTESMVGGGSAKACDKAEEMLKEMHKNLDQKYGVKTDKITWDDQDPSRVLKQAEQLPDNAGTAMEDYCE